MGRFLREVRQRYRSTAIVSLVSLAVLVSCGSPGVDPQANKTPSQTEQYLRQGWEVTLTAPESTRKDDIDRTVEILRTRIDGAGVDEPEISREGDDNIFIQLPDVKDRERLLHLIGQSAQLQFRQVLQTLPKGDPSFASAPVSADDDPDAEVVLPNEDGSTRYRLSKAELAGDAVRRAAAAPNPDTGAWEISIDFRSQGGKQWEAFTGKLACLQGEQRQIAIVLDGIVESSPQVASSVECNKGISGGRTQVTGNFEKQEAKDIALLLTAGSLPVKLEQSEIREFRKEVWGSDGATRPSPGIRGVKVRVPLKQDLAAQDFELLLAQVRSRMQAKGLRDGSLTVASDSLTGRQQIAVQVYGVEGSEYSDMVINSLRTGKVVIDFDPSDADFETFQTY